ncbi:hypothetical protein [Sanguibacter sp. 25GB23B1]|uniref:hypothetical protein n=1 Tax=unclassified Sanguibacter TaxID=2645534 RepID=UPI0032AFA9EB
MSDLAAPAPTGTVEIHSVEDLLAKITRVEESMDLLSTARTELEKITMRPARQAWSTVPSLVSFAGTYVGACSATIAVVDKAEAQVVGMADAIRLFAAGMDLQDTTALDALAGLEKKVEEALAPTPLPVPDRQQDGRIIKTHMHQQPF